MSIRAYMRVTWSVSVFKNISRPEPVVHEIWETAATAARRQFSSANDVHGGSTYDDDHEDDVKRYNISKHEISIYPSLSIYIYLSIIYLSIYIYSERNARFFSIMGPRRLNLIDRDISRHRFDISIYIYLYKSIINLSAYLYIMMEGG